MMSIEQLLSQGDPWRRQRDPGRGHRTYSLSQIVGVTGRTKDGDLLSGDFQYPVFALSVYERLAIFQLCAPIFGVISGRMNRISSVEWEVVPEKKNEDKIVATLKDAKMLYDEYGKSDDIEHLVGRSKIAQIIRAELPECLPDLSNFDRALLRWKRRVQSERQDRADEISEWLQHPNNQDRWIDFAKQYAGDLLIHGGVSIYKEASQDAKTVDNIYILPGGTVFPLRSRYAGGPACFVQICDGLEPQIFFKDEITHVNHVPLSARPYGFVPLDCLVNKIAENLFFDELMAQKADGSTFPEKVVVFGGNNPFGDFRNGEEGFDIPADPEEERRVEDKLNEMRKHAIRTLTGYGRPLVLDLSRSDTLATQLDRQRMIREEIALVFNLSNLEVNLTGSADTSGRATSESQERIDQEKSIVPILYAMEMQFNNDIIPFKFGRGYRLDFRTQMSEEKEISKYRSMVDSGIWSVNEVRVDEMNMDPYADPQFDLPKSSQQQIPQELIPGGGAGGMSGMIPGM
jgi:phage portal protein BeeE